MSYEEFKENLLTELRSFYGNSAVITVEKIWKNNSSHLEGIQIRRMDRISNAAPVIRLDNLYREYQRGMELEECVKIISDKVENFEYPKAVEEFTKKLKDWKFAQKYVYPVLLSVKENEELLENLVFTPILDLAVTYVLRIKCDAGVSTCMRVEHKQLEYYGIDKEELHRQALCNMEHDGYRFQNISEILREMDPISQGKEVADDEVPMYVLTNQAKSYGAAGILNQKVVQEFAGGRSFYILPSSLHETIFVPAEEECDPERLDCMVADINQTTVSKEERLSDHSYYYDGETGNIRLCA